MVLTDDQLMASLAHGGSIAMPNEARRINAVSSDGTRLATQSWGDPAKPAIVFIHGFAQSHLSWLRQVRSDLAHSFHLVTFDLRGHGGSDKPTEARHYDNARVWADDLVAVMEATGVTRALLVAWSLGGRCAFDYLAEYGESRIVGVNLIGADVTGVPGTKASGSAPLRPLMRSSDPSRNIAGTREFLRRCFFRQPEQGAFEEMLAFNMLSPPDIRGLVLSKGGQPQQVIRGLHIPVLLTLGLEDTFASLENVRASASILRNAQLSLYEAVGHAPFYEAPDRYNAELHAFAERAFTS